MTLDALVQSVGAAGQSSAAALGIALVARLLTSAVCPCTLPVGLISMARVPSGTTTTASTTPQGQAAASIAAPAAVMAKNAAQHATQATATPMSLVEVRMKPSRRDGQSVILQVT
jgi:hypothetical protein